MDNIQLYNEQITENMFLDLKLEQEGFIFKLFSPLKLIEEKVKLDASEREFFEMDYFKLGKHQIVEENLLFTSKILYELLENEMHIDELFLLYAKKQGVVLNLNIERILYLSLTFLFSVEKILINKNLIKRNIL